jgi:predicted aspartyl protease
MVSRWLGVPVCIGCIGAGSLLAEVRLEMREGRPVVDGVFVNGHGPYRFLIDTGSNLNLIEKRVGDAMGLVAAAEVEVKSSAGKTRMVESDGNEISLGSATARGQKLLVSAMREIRSVLPEVHGVLGQWFLGRFDYLLDIRGRRIEFGKQERTGRRLPSRLLNGRMAIWTSLGELLLDSGAVNLVRFGVTPDRSGMKYVETVAGGRFAGSVESSLSIDGRNVWSGTAVAMPETDEAGVAGLMPVGLFRKVYVCNSEGYVVLE